MIELARRRGDPRGARPCWRSGSCASGCARSTDIGTPPTRSPPATSRSGSTTRTRAPRSAASGARSTRCSARIEESFAERRESERRLRQFVADASHELQTPLTSVRGYAELFRRGAAERPDDLSHRDAPHRGRGRRAWACWSTTCCCSPASTRAARWTRAPVDLRGARRTTSSATRAWSSPTARSTFVAPEPVVIDGDDAAPAPGGRQPAEQRARPHAAGHARDRARAAPRGRRGGDRGRRPGPGTDARARRAGVRALLPRRPVARAGQRRQRAGAVDRVRHRRGPRRTGRGRDQSGSRRHVPGAAPRCRVAARSTPASLPGV